MKRKQKKKLIILKCLSVWRVHDRNFSDEMSQYSLIHSVYYYFFGYNFFYFIVYIYTIILFTVIHTIRSYFAENRIIIKNHSQWKIIIHDSYVFIELIRENIHSCTHWSMHWKLLSYVKKIGILITKVDGEKKDNRMLELRRQKKLLHEGIMCDNYKCL